MFVLLAVAGVLVLLAWQVHAWFLASLFFLVTSARMELRPLEDAEGSHGRFLELSPTLWLGVAVAAAVVPRLQARSAGRVPPFASLLPDGVVGGLALGGALFVVVLLTDGLRRLLGRDGAASEGHLGLPLLALAFGVVASQQGGLAASAPGRWLSAHAREARWLLLVPCGFLAGRFLASMWRPRVRTSRDPEGAPGGDVRSGG